MSKNNKLPLLTEQTFQDAGGKDLFGKLKMLGLVEGYIKDSINSKNQLDNLVEKVKSVYGKVDYIFDIKYEKDENKEFAKGTAYKKNGWLRNYFSGWSWRL